MSTITRRESIGHTLGVVAAAKVLGAAPPATAGGALGTPRRTLSPGRAGIRLALMMSYRTDHKSRVGRQIGVNHAIAGVLPALVNMPRTEYEARLAKVVADFREAGLKVAGVESHPVPAEKIKLGVEGRDEEIENYIAAIKAMGNVGIPVLCYNFMAGLGWYRTRVDSPGRGGALITEFNNDAARTQGLTKWGEIHEEKIWDNITYFLKAVIPVAEKAEVRMALHPDDPPLTPLRGIGRIVTSAANYRRIMNIVPSPVNGITFCQANFIAMG
ncbi:MAG TPA: mannonate dehydratase, partial [Bryobacteraceae bacterium]|nr:mannonate dehydratase [Bryobacteraceae bacterium]